jgi:murein DD-endopeptidase MepM/ murein hydrolase activator NlpD
LTPANSLTGTASSEWGWTRQDEYGNPDYHNGFDDAAEIGAEVLAAGAGVATVGRNDVAGLYIMLDLENGYSVSYSHLSSVSGNLEPGSQFTVSAGDVLGSSGVSGNSQGSGRDPHVHVVTREGNQDMNPRCFFSSGGERICN